MKKFRVGFIVPSSNTTMETEIPEMLRRREQVIQEETFTCHSSRMRMQHVTKEELAKMDQDSDRCAVELADADCDALLYACLVAIMSQGVGYHLQCEARLSEVTKNAGYPTPVISSAGSLVNGIHTLGAKRVAIVTPYVPSLTQLVKEYIESHDIEVVDAISLNVSDNLEVGRLDPMNLPNVVERLSIQDADAVVLSACVQMQSLPAIPVVQERIGKPVLSAATATVYDLLKRLGIKPLVPDAGALLSGTY